LYGGTRYTTRLPLFASWPSPIPSVMNTFVYKDPLRDDRH
jgi:hypothetical protein